MPRAVAASVHRHQGGGFSTTLAAFGLFRDRSVAILAAMSADLRIQAAIAALEAQRPLLGGAVVDASVAALRSQLVARQITAAERAQKLKQVTIVFLDVVGSTFLSQRLDPEDIHDVIDGALARCSDVVDAFGGQVLQYAGDSVLAVFGADETKEDDAERAVRCGLALLALARELSEELRNSQHDAGFNVRVGINTGGVSLGGGAGAPSAIRGVAVNIAARMEQTAPAGSLRISHATYVHVRGVFDVEAQDPLSIKGVDERVVTYLVLGVKPRAFRVSTRGIEGMETRMIGRESELQQLQGRFQRVFDQHKLAIVTVVADAGIGKSRLVYEFDNWAEAQAKRFAIFRGRATPHAQRQPYGLLRDIIAWRLEIADDEPLHAARHKIEQEIGQLFVGDDSDLAESHAHVLGHLLGFDFSASPHIRGIRDDPRQIRNRAFHVAAQMLRRVSAKEGMPIVLQLEDVHWADDGSLEFLRYIAQVNRDVPMLIVACARPTLFERNAEWQRANEDHLRIDLSPLDRGSSELLADELLKRLVYVPAALRELVIGRAEGNPFYMEELVKMLIDQGAIATHGSYSKSWTLHSERLVGANVPPTLVGVLQSRLDGLPTAEREALQRASIVGHIFWDRALAALDGNALESLPSLVRRGLISPRSAVLPEGMREYVFQHQLLHQVTYDTVLKQVRVLLHGRVARWLSELAVERANIFLSTTAEHFEKAGETASAAEYHARAAEEAVQRFAHPSALEHVQRALALIDANPTVDFAALRWRLLDLRERTYEREGKRSEQRQNVDALERLAETLDDDARRAQVALIRNNLAMRTADWQASEAFARRAIALAERNGDCVLRLSAHHRLAVALASSGDHKAGKALAQQGLAEAHTRGLPQIEVRFLDVLSTIAYFQDDPMSRLALTKQALSLNEELGDRRGQAIQRGNLGASWLALGELALGQRNLEECLRLARASGDLPLECTAVCNLSLLAFLQGEPVRAEALAKAALEAASAVEAHAMEVGALMYLGNAELCLGHCDRASQSFERARTLALELGLVLHHEAAAGLARVALAQNDACSALRHVEGVLAHVAAGGTLEGADSAIVVELTCYRTLMSNRDQRAAEWLKRAYTQLQARAATISDEALRQAFLENIPSHRDVTAAWLASSVPAK